MIIGSNLIFSPGLTSTNVHSSLLIKNKTIPEGTVVYTDFQTAGKGQAGNRWESEKGKNLLISIILYPNSVMAQDQFFISIVISVGICDFIDVYCRGSRIKWPNDIYINNDKIAGILIENSIIGESVESTIAGIGLNINQEKFPSHIPNPVSLKMITGKEYDTGRCLNQLLTSLDDRYKQLLYGDRDQLANEYQKHLYRLNEWHLFLSEGRTFKGRLTGTSPAGQVRIEEKNGIVREYDFKEVEYIRPFSSNL